MLHNLAALGNDECIELVLEKAGDTAASLVSIRDVDGFTPLHLCAAFPMTCYLLASQSPSTCLICNQQGSDPIELAAKHGSGEALNALLLACSDSATPEALDAITQLTSKGAVPDTWAPNGQSALMIAAAANNTAGVKLLLSKGASLELQDALGRTAMMWAAGCNAAAAMTALLDAGASVAHRDRRGRTVENYTSDFPEVKAVLRDRVTVMESKAAAAQEALLAELSAEEERRAALKATKRAKKKAAKVKKKRMTPNGTEGCTSDFSEKEEILLTEEDKPESQQQFPSTSSISSPKLSQLPPTEHSEMTAIPGESTSHQSFEERERSSTPPMATSIGFASSPQTGSPEWFTVGKHSKSSAKSFGIAEEGVIPAPSSVSVGRTGGGGFHATVQHRRSPSTTSVASTCSAASHDTEASRQSGSERSVLGRTNVGTSPQPLIPRLPAQPSSRKTSILSRGSSGVEEVLPTSNRDSRMLGVLEMAASPAKVRTVFQSGTTAATWASVAIGQHINASGCNDLPSAIASLSVEERSIGRGNQQQQRPHSPVEIPVGPLPSKKDPSPSSSSPTERQLASEIEALRTEIRRLHVQQATMELTHQRELAAVLQDAARHESQAVAQAVSDERMSCAVRFAGYLQSHDAALAAAMPRLVADVTGVSHPSASNVDIRNMTNNYQGSIGLEAGASEAAVNATAIASLGFPTLSGADQNAATAPSTTPVPARHTSKPNSLFDGKHMENRLLGGLEINVMGLPSFIFLAIEQQPKKATDISSDPYTLERTPLPSLFISSRVPSIHLALLLRGRRVPSWRVH